MNRKTGCIRGNDPEDTDDVCLIIVIAKTLRDFNRVFLHMEIQGILRIMIHKQPQPLSMSGGALLKGW